MTDGVLYTNGDDVSAVDPHPAAGDAMHRDRLDRLEWWRLWRELRMARFAWQHSKNAAAWTQSAPRREQCQRDADAAQQYAALVLRELKNATPQSADGRAGLQPGQQVSWLHVPRGGYGYVQPVAAEVVGISKQRVRIPVWQPDGTAGERSVRPEHLRA